MKRCSRCILPEVFPGIEFDATGVCNRCHEHEALYLSRDFSRLKHELEGIFNWARRQRKPFDCLVPISGGKDSAYALFVCSHVYGLRTLAVNFNNGLRTPEALLNMEETVRRGSTGYVCYGPPWQTLRALYRVFFVKTGQFCFPCDMGIWATVHRIAEQYDVPLIVSAFSDQMETRGPKIYCYNNRLFKLIAEGVVSRREMKEFLALTVWNKLLRRLKHGRLSRYRRQISLPDYVPWPDKHIKETIQKELGWRPRSDGSSDHVDCVLAPMKNYLMIQKWGFGEKTIKYSAMVRTGELTREEALRRAEHEEQDKDYSDALATFRVLLQVSEQDIAEAPGKSHLPYL